MARNHNTQEETPDNAKKQAYSILEMFPEDDDVLKSGDHKAFMQLYASLMILLMTFFIVIYSYSTHSQAKFELAKKSLYKVFETVGLKDARQIISFFKSKVPSTQKATENHRELLISLAEISKRLEDEFGGAEVEIRRFQTKIIIENGKIFDTDQVVFNEVALPVLENIVSYIKKDAYSQIVISSHFASIRYDQKTEASSMKDWHVSSLRAIRIAKYFADNGIAHELISAMGHGNIMPVIYLDKQPGGSNRKNIRIEIIIKKPLIAPEDEYDILITDI